MTVHVLHRGSPNPYGGVEIDTTSGSGPYRQLSPFVLGPIPSYVPGVSAKNFENLWQYSKVYLQHLDSDGEPSIDWYVWRAKGWIDKRAHRYPMGRGKKPEYSSWEGEKLGYIEARKRIYTTIYAEHVRVTRSFSLIETQYKTDGSLVLRDYDAHDHIHMGMSLVDVINNPDRIMGHAFVLAMMLEGVLEECLRS